MIILPRSLAKKELDKFDSNNKEEEQKGADKMMFDRKTNIFEHVFYEFDMYLYTYQRIIEIGKYREEESFNQNEYNMAWDAHFLHLRNLIEFFNDEKNCISAQDILCCEYDLKVNSEWEYYGETMTFKKVINKTVDHLTMERLEGKVWAEKQLFTIDQMIKIIPQRILTFLELTDCLDNVVQKYQQNLIENQRMKTVVCENANIVKRMVGDATS